MLQTNAVEKETFALLNTSMLVTAKDILIKEPILNEYDGLFHIESSPESKEGIDKLNAFMQLVLPDINTDDLSFIIGPSTVSLDEIRPSPPVACHFF